VIKYYTITTKGVNMWKTLEECEEIECTYCGCSIEEGEDYLQLGNVIVCEVCNYQSMEVQDTKDNSSCYSVKL